MQVTSVLIHGLPLTHLPPFPMPICNLDVLRQILTWYNHESWHTIHDGPDEIRTKTLSSLARVNSTFHVLATTILWQHLDSVIPLLSLLSTVGAIRRDDRWGIHTEVELECITYVSIYCKCYCSMLINHQGLTNGILEADWKRFCYHAAKVHTLVVDELEPKLVTQRVAPTTWVYILHKLAGRTLLPRLQSLHWDISNRGCTGLLCVLSPSVQILTLNFIHPWLGVSDHLADEWRFAMSTLLNHTSHLTTNIHTLNLTLGRLYTPSIFSALLHYQNLCNLVLRCDKVDAQSHGISVCDLYKLGTLPRLMELTVDCHFDLSPFPSVPCPARSPFQALQNLSLRDYSDMDPIYTVFERSSVIKLQVIVRPYQDALTLHHRCSVWSQTFPHLLTFLCEVDNPGAAVPHSSDTSSLSTAIRPLLSLRRMECVTVGFPQPQYHVTDVDLEDMTQAWPRLQGLVLRGHNGGTDAHNVPSLPLVTPTFASLSLAAFNCPMLRILTLPGICISSAAIHHGIAPNVHRLQYLQVFSASIHDYALAAQWIHHLFPALDDTVVTATGKVIMSGRDVSWVERANWVGWERLLLELKIYRESMDTI